MFFSDSEILSYINEDIPYFDLTTSLQNIDKNAILEIKTRDDIVVSCIDISSRIANLLGCETTIYYNNQSLVKSQSVLLKIMGSYNDVHKAWKLCQILLEYTCKISTYTNLMLNSAKSVNKKCEILATRKSFPFAKKICIKAVLEGGGGIHRLNLSDSVLFFENHIKAYKNFDEFLTQIPIFKAKMPEKKISVECENLKTLNKLLDANVDIVQCDKFDISMLQEAVNSRNQKNPNITIVASGGINLKNVKEYANTGVDAIVTSAMYAQGMANLTSTLKVI
ncbi:ModD protein [Campylobacter sp. RM16187]|uniref:ModD protein n=1 Tax=Campylobacter sp. RM16187 TaxID=1660063 RepID=UPI0021B62E44|nr:ModD protein [Campylobacter sp. RM16187]QKG29105.1 quinolinate phosphoribosyltransferase-like protein [Campylobacter sp. RM16187]